MINLYGLNDIDYTKNGKAVLKPTSCLVSEQAGGSYELNMVLPMDARGTYRMAELEDIVKVPVPVATIESAVVGENVAVTALPAPEEWTTERGLEVFGPRSFGHDVEYTPYC